MIQFNGQSFGVDHILSIHIFHDYTGLVLARKTRSPEVKIVLTEDSFYSLPTLKTK